MANTRFPIKVARGTEHAQIYWAKPSARSLCAALRSWGPATGSANQLDAVEMAYLVAQKWEAIFK